MRRLVVLAGLVVALAGCGGGEETTAEPATVEGEVTTQAEEPAGEGDAENGKQIFAAQGCGSCHVLADAGASGTVGPNLDESQPSVELAVDRVTNGAGVMPSFKDKLSEQEIRDVATYVSEAAGGG
jgi:mono/diheme cytochrome c family protein